MIERLGGELRRELARFGPTPGMAEIVAAWPTAVGDGVARNAWPARLTRDRTLVVHASSSSWAFELEQLRETVLAGLAAAVGELAPRALRFVVGPLPEPATEATALGTRNRRAPGPEHLASARVLAAAIEDEELRKVVAKAAAESLARADYGRSFW